MGRKHARESTMQLLFQMEVNLDFSNKVMDVFFENNHFNIGEKEYIKDAITTIVDNMEEIDENIQVYLKGWELHRLAKVDLSTLRIAMYEISHRKDIPVEVSINEAIEIAKKYSTEESSKYINGVLGSFVRAKDENA